VTGFQTSRYPNPVYLNIIQRWFHADLCQNQKFAEVEASKSRQRYWLLPQRRNNPKSRGWQRMAKVDSAVTVLIKQKIEKIN
jgi:hypothetical protein